MPALVPRRAPGACVVSAAGALDLDHARPEVGKHHRRERPGKDPGEVDDPEVLERLGHRGEAISNRHAGHSTPPRSGGPRLQ